MRGRSKGTELEKLDIGLQTADEDFIPGPIEAELGEKTPEELVTLAEMGDRLEDAVKIRNGWIYLMLRRKVGHGSFKPYLEEHHIKYTKAWQCMCYARAVLRYPSLAGALTGHAIRHVLRLPAEQVAQIEEQITGIPSEEVSKITRTWIEREYRKIQEEKARNKPKKNPKQLEARISKFDKAFTKAHQALCELSVVEITPEDYEDIFSLEMLAKLGKAYSLVVEHLHPEEEREKRKDKGLVHAPGFGGNGR